MDIETCNNTSVGILVRQDDRLLLIERRNPPYGWAPPAGHVEDDETYEQAARRELFEETGLTATGMRLLLTGRYPLSGSGYPNTCCRRPGGWWHWWNVFRSYPYYGETEPKRDGNQVSEMGRSSRFGRFDARHCGSFHRWARPGRMGE